jgi:hypothetical protein
VRNGQSKYPLVLIEWEDSQRPLSPWQWVDEYSLPDAVHCLSVGFLIAQTKAAFALAPNLGDVDQERAQACGIIRIPACSVLKLTTLAPSRLGLREAAGAVSVGAGGAPQAPRSVTRRSAGPRGLARPIA